MSFQVVEPLPDNKNRFGMDGVDTTGLFLEGFPYFPFAEPITRNLQNHGLSLQAGRLGNGHLPWLKIKLGKISAGQVA